jgi:hypothetical protein
MLLVALKYLPSTVALRDSDRQIVTPDLIFGMPPRFRLLLLAGIGLTLIALVGMAVMIAVFPESNLSPIWFVPPYLAGALCLMGSAIWWAVRLLRRRDPK